MSRRLRSVSVLSVVAGSALVSLVGCGGGAVGAVVQPKPTTAAEALGEAEPAKCRAVANRAEPLIVDWKSSDRVDLEVGMKEGLVVVAYDCKTPSTSPAARATTTPAASSRRTS